MQCSTHICAVQGGWGSLRSSKERPPKGRDRGRIHRDATWQSTEGEVKAWHGVGWRGEFGDVGSRIDTLTRKPQGF